MLVLLVFILLILFYARVYLYEFSRGATKGSILVRLFRRIYSFHYFLPQEYIRPDGAKGEKYNKLSNYCLYLFYVVFLLIIIFSATKVL